MAMQSGGIINWIDLWFHALRKKIIKQRLSALPGVAVKGGKKLGKHLNFLIKVAGENKALKDRIIDRIFSILLDTMKSNKGAAYYLVNFLPRVAGENEALKGKIIRRVFDMSPAMANQNEKITRYCLADILPDVVGKNKALNDSSVDYAFAALPAMAETSRLLAEALIKNIAKTAGVPVEAFNSLFGCGEKPDGEKIALFVFQPPSPKHCIGFALKRPDASPVILRARGICQYFSRAAAALTEETVEIRSQNAKYHKRYEEFVTAAHEAFKRPAPWPSMPEAGRERLAAWRTSHPQLAP